MRDSFNQTKRSFDDVVYIAQKDTESKLDDYGNKNKKICIYFQKISKGSE